MSGQRHVVSCVTHNGRPEREGAERGLGMFLNSLPLSVELSQGSWRELIEQVAAIGMASMQYRSYPLSSIQRDLNWVFSEVLFNYTHFHIYQEIAGSEAQGLEALGGIGFEQTNFDLLVDVSRGMNDDAMEMGLVYNAQVFDEALMKRMSGYYVRAFEQMLAGLNKRHSAQTLLSAEEEQQLAEWNETAVAKYLIE